MSTNLKELRKEAYRLWGIGNQKVVFDYPIRKKSYQRFHFKLDYGKDKASWPRAYALSDGYSDISSMRVIMPIIMIKRFNDFTIEANGWYDMPRQVHEKIIELINDRIVHRDLPIHKKIWNYLTPINFNYSDVPNIEDYEFIVSQQDKDFIVMAV